MENNKEKIRKSSKVHLCYLCDSKISRGDPYVDKVIFIDGFTKTKTHINCESLYVLSESIDKATFIENVLHRYAQRKDQPDKTCTQFKSKIDFLSETIIE